MWYDQGVCWCNGSRTTAKLGTGAQEVDDAIAL